MDRRSGENRVFASPFVDHQSQVTLGSLRTFTVRMPDAGYDESESAAAVAHHLGTDHTAIDLSESDAMEAIVSLPHMYDEPLGDPSMLPTVLLCTETRGHGCGQ